MVKAKIVQRLLGDEDWVGKLTLMYYDGDASPRSKVIPFYENPDISETQAARYTKMSPIGRAGNLYAYNGSDSRKLSVSFNLTLPHISYQGSQGILAKALLQPSRAKQQEEIENAPASIQTSNTDKAAGSGDAKKLYELYSRTLLQKDQQSWSLLNSIDFFGQALDNFNPAEMSAERLQEIASTSVNGTKVDRATKVIDAVMDHIISIRSCVLNNVRYPQFGPPIVRLSWGIMYQDVPCVCHSYSIKVNDQAGYDQETLLPRKIEVTMNLEEARNYGEFDRASEIHKDSLAGWEVLLDAQNPTNTDPGFKY